VKKKSRTLRLYETRSAEERGERPHVDDLSFPPPFFEQAKYLELADKFLSTNGIRHKNALQIDSSKHFQKLRKKKAA